MHKGDPLLPQQPYEKQAPRSSQTIVSCWLRQYHDSKHITCRHHHPARRQLSARQDTSTTTMSSKQLQETKALCGMPQKNQTQHGV